MKNMAKVVIAGGLLTLLWGANSGADPVKPKLSMEQATAIAIKKVPGTVKSSEFEHEMGQDVYSFDIAGKNGAIHEILINANTGKIVSNKIESAAKEAKEAAEEKK